MLYPVFWSPTEYIEPIVSRKLLPYLRADGDGLGGPRRIGVLGFCWGGWVALRTAGAETGVDCVAALHPSMKMEAFHGGCNSDVYDAIRCPTMCLAAGDDPEDVKPEGELSQSLTRRGILADLEEFKEMDHGWVVRGDATDGIIADAVTTALQKTFQFLKRHVSHVSGQSKV